MAGHTASWQLRDWLREKYQIHKRWREIRELRERAMAKRHVLNQKHYNIHSHPLRELQVGESVQVQKPRGTTLTAVDENREGCRENEKQAIPGTSRRKQQSHCVTGNFSGKSFRWLTHRTIRPRNHNHSFKGRCQSTVKLHA